MSRYQPVTSPAELSSDDIYFTVIIPTLNEEPQIGSLLDDLSHQMYSRYEIIHVDAGSVDATCQVVADYQSHIPVRTLHSPRCNLSYQRNLGSEHARGEYLVFVDADSRLRQTDFFSVLESHCVKSRDDIYLPRAVFESVSPLGSLVGAVNNMCVRLSTHSIHPLPTSGLSVISRRFYREVGGYAVREEHDKGHLFVEDQEFMERARIEGARMQYVSDVSYSFSLRRFDREGWIIPSLRVVLVTACRWLGLQHPRLRYRMGGDA